MKLRSPRHKNPIRATKIKVKHFRSLIYTNIEVVGFFLSVKVAGRPDYEIFAISFIY